MSGIVTATRRSPEEVDAALTTLVLNGGQLKRTAEQTGIPWQTIQNWRNTHVERYQEIAEKYAPELERRQLAAMQAVITQALEGTEEAVQAARTEIKTGKTKDAASTARNLATVAGITTDKVLTLPRS